MRLEENPLQLKFGDSGPARALDRGGRSMGAEIIQLLQSHRSYRNSKHPIADTFSGFHALLSGIQWFPSSPKWQSVVSIHSCVAFSGFHPFLSGFCLLLSGNQWFPCTSVWHTVVSIHP